MFPTYFNPPSVPTGGGGGLPAPVTTPGRIAQLATNAIKVANLTATSYLNNARAKQVATNCADTVEAQMDQSRNIYLSTADRTAADQQVAIETFDKLARSLYHCCGAAELGDPGVRCLSERLRVEGGRWINGSTYAWVSWYLQPILDDSPQELLGSPTGVGAIDKAAQAVGISPWWLILGVAGLYFGKRLL